MIKSLFKSNINMALKCGEQFRRRYGLNQRIPPGIAAGRGISVHYANEVNVKQKIISGVDMPVNDLTDAARDKYVDTFKNGVFMTRKEIPEKRKLLNQGLNDAVRITRFYGNVIAPTIKPLDVEVYLKADIGLDIPLVGILDNIQLGNNIKDIKSSTRKWPEGRATEDTQPYIYGFLYEKNYGVRPTYETQVLTATKTKTYPQYYPVDITDRAINTVIEIAHRVHRMVKAGVFMPANRGAWWCSEKWCGYYLTCPYVGNGKQLNWV